MTGKTINQTLRQFRLRTTLGIPFVLQIAAAVGLVGFSCFQAGRTTVGDLASYPELDWSIVAAIPEADFMEQIDTNTRNAVLLCLGALGLEFRVQSSE